LNCYILRPENEAFGMPFSGGTNPTVTNGDYQAYIDAAEPYSFNAIGCL